MIEVFKTDISNREEVERIRGLLAELFPGIQVTIDINDCDKVLRIEGKFSSENVIDLVMACDHRCEVLE